jgi:ectoine hydroxylase-related dioxygenase (phytanoyl-CoA dioxygenase family)
MFFNNLQPKFEHYAPEKEPFNYQIPDSKKVAMTAAPVNKGGINLHHGKTIHQSSNNTSDLWRRAMAIHYMQKQVRLVNPIFEFDPVHYVKAY